MFGQKVRYDLRIRIFFQDINDKGRRCRYFGVLYGCCNMHTATFYIFPHMNRRIHQFTEIVVYTFADHMFQTCGEREELFQRKSVDFNTFATKYSCTRFTCFGDHMNGSFHTVLYRCLYPCKFLVRARSPQIISFFHICPEPVHHLRCYPGKKMLFL